MIRSCHSILIAGNELKNCKINKSTEIHEKSEAPGRIAATEAGETERQIESQLTTTHQRKPLQEPVLG